MTSPSALVAQLRADSGLSQRALAARAGCTRSTIVRIESGDMDPTVTMLARITAAAGRRLTLSADEVSGSISLASFAGRCGSEENPDWTRLRSLLDWLHLHPGDAREMVSDPPRRTGSDVVDNLLAAVAEKVADDAGMLRPSWAACVAPLNHPWYGPGTARMKAAGAAAAPPQLARRNILIAEENVWRRRV